MAKSNRMSPRKKSPESRFQGMVRPSIILTESENWKVEEARVRLQMEKGQFIKDCVFYCINHNIDPRES